MDGSSRFVKDIVQLVQQDACIQHCAMITLTILNALVVDTEADLDPDSGT